MHSHEGGIAEQGSDSVHQTLNQEVVCIGITTILASVNGTHCGQAVIFWLWSSDDRDVLRCGKGWSI